MNTSAVFSSLIHPLALLAALLLTPPASAAPSAGDEVIIGAGAHFSWAVFDALKPGLEQKSGRTLKLYGKESMLGAGCNAGIKLAKENAPGHETFGFVCCPLSDEEIAKNGLRLFPLAIEPILIMVNEANPITDLSAEQVRAVFRGEITNWKEVGGQDLPIVVVTRLHCKNRPGHWKTILPNAKDFRQERLNVNSAAEMINRINAFPGAIGHVGSAWLFDPEDKVKSVTVGGIAPTAANLKANTYLFFRQLSAVTNQHPSADLLGIIREAQRELAAGTVAKRYELLPLGVIEQ